MMKNKSLFITSKDDSHSDYIINKINELDKGQLVVRLNTEDFVTNCKVVFTEDDFRIELKDSNRNISKNEIYSVWFRRPKQFSFLASDNRQATFIEKQSQSLLRGIYFATHDTSKWINPLPSLHRARIKLQQLVLAKSIGFNVPKTIATNSPNEVVKFIQSVEHISTKSLDEPSYQSDKHIFPLFNKVLKKEFIEKYINNISSCPTLFQEYIDKKSDIRVVVIGNDIFPFEIFSQENQLSVEDFRGVAPAKLRHEFIKLPVKLKKQIFDYMRKQNLFYSSFDFVKSKNNVFYFIENNPNGQWLWLELQTGVKISDSLIHNLLK